MNGGIFLQLILRAGGIAVVVNDDPFLLAWCTPHFEVVNTARGLLHLVRVCSIHALPVACYRSDHTTIRTTVCTTRSSTYYLWYLHIFRPSGCCLVDVLYRCSLLSTSIFYCNNEK